MPTWVWFLIAVVALLAGVALLLADRRAGGAAEPGARDRRRWASVHDWEYHDSDSLLTNKWRYGTVQNGGPGIARAVAAGTVPTPEGGRAGYVFDHEQQSKVNAVVVAVELREPLPAAVELRLPSAPLPDSHGGAGLDLLEPVGERYSFVSDADAIRPLLTQRVADASDAVGDDIELVWAEDAWVLAAAPVDTSPERAQDLLADVAQVATALEHALDEARHPA
ncbi:hypothetical protein [Pseudonocardia sp. WMMC193]|uniref:hypothetical protein n=1 Tax=Pseudonocardia sp. WMMC193 TaxID=2911965 RepID=UPI001F26E734|nr:hypothetical protein [Pseudonocardia sp. WMMC193]MCF7552086.1 hypothetical protein [Pseudonocardia sp. WMMC193]